VADGSDDAEESEDESETALPLLDDAAEAKSEDES
jgi:hypothetical protein